MKKILSITISTLEISTLLFIYISILEHLIAENILLVPEGSWRTLFYFLSGGLISPVLVAIIKYNRKDNVFD